MGALHHSTSCAHIRPAFMGKCVKDAVVAGFKASFGLSISRGEPVLSNIPGVSRRASDKQLAKDGAKVKIKARADFAFSSGGTVYVVDTTSSSRSRHTRHRNRLDSRASSQRTPKRKSVESTRIGALGLRMNSSRSPLTTPACCHLRLFVSCNA